MSDDPLSTDNLWQFVEAYQDSHLEVAEDFVDSLNMHKAHSLVLEVLDHRRNQVEEALPDEIEIAGVVYSREDQ